MNEIKLGNPAVVGLAGFGLTTLLLQLHNLGLCGLGPVLAMGIIFGGLAQFIAGFMEQKTGNNFGFVAFTSYGAFWIGLGIIWMCNFFKVYETSGTDLGLYLVAWTLLTAILTVGAMYIHSAMATTFTTLLLGFILLDLGHLGFPEMNTVAAYVLIFTALCAWYMMAMIVLNDLTGTQLLKAGKPWLKVNSSSDTQTETSGAKQQAEVLLN